MATVEDSEDNDMIEGTENVRKFFYALQNVELSPGYHIFYTTKRELYEGFSGSKIDQLKDRAILRIGEDTEIRVEDDDITVHAIYHFGDYIGIYMSCERKHPIPENLQRQWVSSETYGNFRIDSIVFHD